MPFVPKEAMKRRKSEITRLENRFFGCFCVSKCHFLIANRRSVSRYFAVSRTLIVGYADGHSIGTRRKYRPKIDRIVSDFLTAGIRVGVLTKPRTTFRGEFLARVGFLCL